MVRANIKNSDGIYIGLIDEVLDRFMIVWNRNIYLYPEHDFGAMEESYSSYEKACDGVRKIVQDAIISATIYFRSR